MTTGVAELRKAGDWQDYVLGWRKADAPPREHLEPGAIFSDAPFAPEMVVVPAGSFAMGESVEEIVGEAPNPLDNATQPQQRVPSGWNKERVQLLKKLWADGLSANQIAGRLGGVTRNAVISKVRRLGLVGRITAAPLNADHLRKRAIQVTIALPFAVGRFAVTFEEWEWAQAHPEWRRHAKLKPRQPEGRGRRPVIDMSWADAQVYCRWLTAVTGKSYRLLSEAEWEYCCRAGTAAPFWWGASISASRANYDGRYTPGDGAKGEYGRRTVPVDSFEANPWGFYQVHGNVWEWCQDVWHDSYEGAPDDGSPWLQGGDASRRVLRGGSWDYLPRLLRSDGHLRNLTGFGSRFVGFRVVRMLSAGAGASKVVKGEQ